VFNLEQQGRVLLQHQVLHAVQRDVVDYAVWGEAVKGRQNILEKDGERLQRLDVAVKARELIYFRLILI
jgi:hypothetical protein